MVDLIDVAKGVATAALMAFVTRCVTMAKGSDSPKIKGAVTIYRTRWPVRASGIDGSCASQLSKNLDFTHRRACEGFERVACFPQQPSVFATDEIRARSVVRKSDSPGILPASEALARVGEAR